ncbi:hypothetical protein AAT19DRAFT_16179 [Rhodotorula toruloides]|uniref:Uncharacterized protein n=1 Tax=Rhodotorula toruloides TaxID=5286 RepID=A0A2T0A690_RHOTO|nr:hypothetical protein AAT19DRAFT_16179 [Rhodotorula toruloides]
MARCTCPELKQLLHACYDHRRPAKRPTHPLLPVPDSHHSGRLLHPATLRGRCRTSTRLLELYSAEPVLSGSLNLMDLLEIDWNRRRRRRMFDTWTGVAGRVAVRRRMLEEEPATPRHGGRLLARCDAETVLPVTASCSFSPVANSLHACWTTLTTFLHRIRPSTRLFSMLAFPGGFRPRLRWATRLDCCCSLLSITMPPAASFARAERSYWSDSYLCLVFMLTRYPADADWAVLRLPTTAGSHLAGADSLELLAGWSCICFAAILRRPSCKPSSVSMFLILVSRRR